MANWQMGTPTFQYQDPGLDSDKFKEEWGKLIDFLLIFPASSLHCFPGRVRVNIRNIRVVTNKIMSLESCTFKWVKGLLFFFNVIFCITGIGILTVGCVILADVVNYNHFMGGRILAPAIILMLIGFVIFVIAFLGCFGAVKEIHMMLIIFAVALLTIFTTELAIGIGIAVFQADVSDILRTTLRESLVTYKDQPDNKDAWDSIQLHFHCCGVDSADDWEESLAGFIPQTCCPGNSTEPCTKDTPSYIHEGCYQVLLRKIRSNSETLMWIGAGIAVIEIIGVMLGFQLATSIKKRRQERA